MTEANIEMESVSVESEPQQSESEPLLPKEHTPAVSKIRSRLYMILFFAIIFIGACLYSCVNPFFPERAMQKGIAQSVVGIVFSSMQLAGLVGACICVMVMFKIGLKVLITTGILVTGFCAIFFGVIDFGPGGDFFLGFSLALRILEGLGIAFYSVSLYTASAVLFPNNLGFIMGLLESSYTFGLLFGPSLGGALFAVGGYFLPFVVLGGTLLVLAPMVSCLIPISVGENDPPSVDKSPNPLQILRKMFNVQMLITSYTMLVTTSSCYFMQSVLGVRLAELGVTSPLEVGAVYLFAVGAAYAIAAPITGRMADRTSHVWLIIMCGSVLLVIGFLIIGPTPFLAGLIPPGLVQLIVGGVCCDLGFSAVLVPITRELQRQAEVNCLDPNSIETIASITCIFQSSFFLGGFFGSVTSSSMMQYLGFGWATTVQSGILSTSLLLQFYAVTSHGVAKEVFSNLCK